MRPQIAILVAIIVASLLTALVSYAGSMSATSTVNELALQNVRSNAEIEASDLSHILANKIEAVTSNLRVISVTEGVQNQDLAKARTVLGTGQNTTADLTSFYMLLDRDGRLLLLSNANETTTQRYNGTDLSYRDYFVKPKGTLQQYYGNVIESNDNVQRVFFSYPVISRGPQQGTAAAVDGQRGAGTFNGVIVAAVDILRMGSFLQSQIPAKYAGAVGLMDSHGVILYSQNAPLIGKKAFGPEFQSLLIPAGREFQQSFNRFLGDSLKGQAGSGHFAVNGTSVTIAYQPVIVRQQNFGVLYVVLGQNAAANSGSGANNSIASSNNNNNNNSTGNAGFESVSLITQQRNLSFLLIAAVGAVAVAAAYLVLSWNRKLESIVKEKTSELDNANRSLAESNAQLVEANEMLKAHDKMQTEFVNIAAHELRTPIQPILGVIELLKSKRGSGDDADGGGDGSGEPSSSSSSLSSGTEITTKQLDIMDRNAKRLQKLSSEILDATRIEAGTLKLDREMMDMNQKVRNVIADSKSWIPPGQSDSVDIQFNPLTKDSKSGEPLPLLVSIDRVRMFEVVSNLLRNAIKFSAASSSDGGSDGTKTITVTTEKKGGQVLVAVKDQGAGISAEVFSRLFTKFSTDRERGGTGLGLFIAKNIVEAHGGRIWAENNRDGKGATFAFTLPLAAAAEPPKV